MTERWNKIWFSPVPVERLAVYRMIVAGYVVFDMLRESHWQVRYGDVSEAFYKPITIVRELNLPRLDSHELRILNALIVLTALFAFAGLFTRVAFALTAVLYTGWFASYYSYGQTIGAKHPLIAAMLVLAVVPAGHAYSLDARITAWRGRRYSRESDEVVCGWGWRFLLVMMAILYMAAAYAKLRDSGIGWFHAGAFQKAIADVGTPQARWIADHAPVVINVISLGAISFEICGFLMLSRFRAYYAAIAITFHIGTALLMAGTFFFGWVITDTIAFPLERLPGLLRRQRRRLMGHESGRRGPLRAGADP